MGPLGVGRAETHPGIPGEEQLLLSMPVVSYHTDQECADKLGYVPAAATGSDAPQAQRENPFAVLKALKKNDSND